MNHVAKLSPETSASSLHFSGRLSPSTRQILDTALKTGACAFEDAVRLLALDPASTDAAGLRHAAHQAALAWTEGKACVWFAIGLDSAPCPRSCSFCSFGAKWGLVKEPWRLEKEEILTAIRTHDLPEVGFIVLRTTDLFPMDELLELAWRATPLRHARLVANIGDFSEDTARALRTAGFYGVYHALRLREGVDTCLDPADRLRTMRVARAAFLELAALTDPIGPEHDNEEIAQSLLVHKEAGASIMGAMARVPVPGTPKAHFPRLSTARLAQVTAVARLVAGPLVPWICSHPPDPALATSGANVVVVECGAIPRDTAHSTTAWRSFAIRDAAAMLRRAGYRLEPDATV